MTRGQELGLRFRPDERDPLYGSRLPAAPSVPDASGDGTFRPIPRRERPTYEALEAERRAESLAPPAMGDPSIIAPPLQPPFGRPPWLR